MCGKCHQMWWQTTVSTVGVITCHVTFNAVSNNVSDSLTLTYVSEYIPRYSITSKDPTSTGPWFDYYKHRMLIGSEQSLLCQRGAERS